MKAVLAAAAALALGAASLGAVSVGGAGLASAQQAASTDTPRYRPSAEDSAALNDARIAALKAGLKLSPEQEKNWPPLEAAMRDFAKQRADRMAARRNAQSGDNPGSRPDAIARLRRNSDAMGAQASAFKQLADAAEPLYKTLDDGQKHRFAVLLRMGGRPGEGPRGSRRG